MTWPFVNPTSGYSTFSRLVSLSVRPSMTTSTAVSLAKLAHDLLRNLVGAQALERRRPDLAAPGPFHELELTDQPGLDEVRALGRLAAIEWARLALHGFHELHQLVEHRVRKSSADLARVHELPVVVVADQQRARQAAALAFAFQPTGDHELLAHVVLDLDPRATAPAGFVGRVEPLAHNALEPGLAARVEHRASAPFLIRRRLPRRALQLQGFQPLATIGVGQLEQRTPVLPHHIEEHVGDRHLFHLAADLRLRRQAHALLDLLEAGPPLLVQRDDLAVEDHLGRAQRASHGVDLRIARGDGLATAAQQLHGSAFDIGLGADAIPLELEAPCGVRGGRLADELGVHGLDARGHRLALWILRRIHPVDHPVLAIGLEQDVAAVDPLAAQDDHHLAVRPLFRLVGTAVPDLHRASAVLALRDLAGEVDVVERVILDVDGEVVLLGV